MGAISAIEYLERLTDSHIDSLDDGFSDRSVEVIDKYLGHNITMGDMRRELFRLASLYNCTSLINWSKIALEQISQPLPEEITAEGYLGRLSVNPGDPLPQFSSKAKAIITMYLVNLWTKEMMATSLFACALSYGEVNSIEWDRLGLGVNELKGEK